MSNIPREVKSRIDSAKDKGRLVNFTYMTQSRLGVEEVRCKTCTALLKSLQVHVGLSKRIEIKGRLLEQQALILTETANYAEIEILFKDGSKHHTILCSPCIDGLQEDMLEDIYASDMQQWDDDEKLGQGEVNWSGADRVPVSFRRIR